MIVAALAVGWALVAAAALGALYHVLLALVGPGRRTGGARTRRTPTHRFAVVIPAHDEAAGIGDTLRSCAELRYPAQLHDTVVVADNCTDRTADVVRSHGVRCLERNDPERRGKGFALAFAFDELLSEDRYDAIVVLDADCLLDPDALERFDAELAAGARVLQADNIVSNPDATEMSYLSALGNIAENDLFYAPKSRLGLAVFLRGTGMVFAVSVLRTHPWSARSVVEDAEYTIELLRGGHRIRYLSGVRVRSEYPVRQEQLSVQRRRWAGGNWALTRSHAPGLILEGLAGGGLALADAGWTLLLLSRPLLMLYCTLVLAWAGLCAWLAPGPASSWLLATALATCLLYVGYAALAVLRLGLSARRLLLLLRTPLVALKLAVISLSGLGGGEGDGWARTPRN